MSLTEMLRKLRSISDGRLWRGLYMVAIISFLMPFVTVYTTRCTEVPGKPSEHEFVRTGESRDYYGFHLIGKSNSGWLYLFPISVAVLLFSLTFARQRGLEILQGFLSSWRAMLSSLSAILMVALPWFQFFPHDVEARIGQKLGFASWALAYTANLTVALVSLVNVRRSREARPFSKPVRFIASRAAYLIMILPAIALWVYSIFDLAIQPYAQFDSTISGMIASFLFPICLAAYFFNQGLNRAEPWAVRSGRWALLLLSTGGGILIILSVTVLRADNQDFWTFVVGLTTVVWLIITVLVGIGGILARSSGPSQGVNSRE